MNLNQMLQPVDLALAAGIAATILGALLLFMSMQGRFQSAVANDVAALAGNNIAQTAHE